MALYIQKFGGSSLANSVCIERVAHIVRATRANGHRVVVVVSAMQGETDRLIRLAHAMDASPAPDQYACLLATGERASSALLSLKLISLGLRSRCFSGAEAGVITTADAMHAEVLSCHPAAVQAFLDSGGVPVVTGFQGVDANGNTTTLGRGGSDLSAVVLADALNADECQIYSDVDRVYTADPNLVPSAHPLSHLTHLEMLALARSGAKVLQAQSVEYATRHSVPLRVLSTFSAGPGTRVVSQASAAQTQRRVSGMACEANVLKVTLLGVQASQEAACWAAFGRSRFLDMRTVNPDHKNPLVKINLSFSSQFTEYKSILDISQGLLSKGIIRSVRIDERLAKLSLIGRGMESHPAFVSNILNILSKLNITTDLIDSSPYRVALLLNAQAMPAAAAALHDFFLAKILPQTA